MRLVDLSKPYVSKAGYYQNIQSQTSVTARARIRTSRRFIWQSIHGFIITPIKGWFYDKD